MEVSKEGRLTQGNKQRKSRRDHKRHDVCTLIK